ncbi:DUF2213 domain-containing protein [Nitratireductor sp. StC3]|uniref:DUF2213 domain-containing protein n=1 Tax=Nitratireductor sp. StC3 TaxID=2126741 RepID=UPI000D0D733A|nr:DUF2213 domain-containing protein [Nitratireductor sp. StC3]PSM18230.1 hypothetical protein C7T96_10185 [Nitratireductor sp. StC3]
MQFTDLAVVAGTRRRDDGYLVADARIARTGVQTYGGKEVGRPEMATARVYRPGAEVFAKDTMASAAHRPVTNDHPADLVTSETWRDVAVGQTGDEVAGEGIYLRVPLMVSDEAAIKDIEAGKRDLSAGYTCDLDWTAGVTPTGEAYDAIQRNIRLNHVAIVRRGRAGPEVRIGDGAASWGAAPISTPTADERIANMADNLRTVVVDGLSVSTTDQGAQAIEKLTKDRDDAKSALNDAEAAHKAAVDAKDGELAKKDAEIESLKGKVLDQAAIDKLVTARADLVDRARSVVPDIKTDGKTDAEIRRAAVLSKLGDDAVKDKGEAYIDARFDILVEDAAKAGKKTDPLGSQHATRTATTDQTVEDARREAEERDRNAWKGKAA